MTTFSIYANASAQGTQRETKQRDLRDPHKGEHLHTPMMLLCGAAHRSPPIPADSSPKRASPSSTAQAANTNATAHVRLQKQMHLRSKKLFLSVSLVRKETSCDANPTEPCLAAAEVWGLEEAQLSSCGSCSQTTAWSSFVCCRRFLDIATNKPWQNRTQKPKSLSGSAASPPMTTVTK